jgi:hypothetical protein
MAPFTLNRHPHRASRDNSTNPNNRAGAPMNQPLPTSSFFSDLADPAEIKAVSSGFGSWYKGRAPTNAMFWYDSIIDDLLAHPGTSLKDCAARLGRSPNTIGLVAASDMFRARYEQRRKHFNEALHERLTSKLTQVAEKALDHTLEALDKKRESIPLPLLHDIAKGSLDRLGYAPQQAGGLVINNNNILPPGAASPAALERARSHMRELNARPASASTSPPVAGPEAEGEGEE